MKTRTDYNTIISTDLSSLVCGGLNYCCLHAFFSLYEKTPASLIALRLGVHRRTVLRWKARWRAGEFSCFGGANCLAHKIPLKPKKAEGHKCNVSD